MPIPGLPSPAIPYNSLIVVTGCTGFIGSHVADQILAAGYRVRGTTRDSRKNAWATEYFGSKYGEGRFELVEVRDLTAADAFKGVVGGGLSSFLCIFFFYLLPLNSR
jgi:NADP-dependent 3-hydroxy acid dehydrogenase YdfG